MTASGLIPLLHRIPPHARGMRIGLYGGSFNPPHAAHLMVAQTALRRLKLDRIWWMVSPGNPLKNNDDLPTLAMRAEKVRAMVHDPRIVVTGLEAGLGTYYSAQTINALLSRCQGVRFVWIMGGDNLTQFHRWGGWRAIMESIPMAVIDRPGATHAAVRARAATAFAQNRIDETDGSLLADLPSPAWMLLHGRRSPLSSTQLREQAHKP
ncbi:MAG: nicotinate-nucleotide adenylyltransferase [Bosea sp. (in: a-proteobacteria)]